jgi:hypothetical protein
MKHSLLPTAPDRHVASTVRTRIDHGGERIWRLEDFAGLPATAVAQTLSRLTREGFIQRLSKGVYYRTRETAFGPSQPNPTSMQQLATKRRGVYPSGISAANLLGFTTQVGRQEVSTSALSLPRKLVGTDIVVRTRRPEVWATLNASEAAMLDFLRTKGTTSELSPAETVRHTLALLAEEGRFEILAKAAAYEPPRVRAMLGAIGQQLGKDAKLLQRLRASLNPFSRFDFGQLVGLTYARDWQAKAGR